MNVGIFGTGIVGRTIAARLVELGHSVVIGTRDPQKTLARTGPDRMGSPPFSEWLQQQSLLHNSQVKLGTFAEAAEYGELLVNATNGLGTLDALNAAGEANLGDKVLVDISNPLDFSQGMPPTLFVSNTDSLGERIQRAFPALKVVKTLNTINAHVMVYPRQLADGNHSVLMSGNDPQAKEQVRALLQEFGWKDIIDLGDITTARGVEMYLPLWLRLWGALGTGILNIQVVR